MQAYSSVRDTKWYIGSRYNFRFKFLAATFLNLCVCSTLIGGMSH